MMALKVSQNSNEVIIKIHLENEDNKTEVPLSRKDYFLQLTSKSLEALRNFSVFILCFAIAKQFDYEKNFNFAYYFFIAVAIFSGVLNFSKFFIELIDLHGGYRSYNKSKIIFSMFVIVIFIALVEIGTIFIFFNEFFLNR